MTFRNPLILAIVTTSFLVAGCGGKDESSTRDDAAIAQQQKIEAGEKLFQQNCSDCHTRAGRGDYIKRIPATLLTRRSTEELMTWIRGSDQHREMPNFDALSDEEREQLAAYLHTEMRK